MSPVSATSMIFGWWKSWFEVVMMRGMVCASGCDRKTKYMRVAAIVVILGTGVFFMFLHEQ